MKNKKIKLNDSIRVLGLSSRTYNCLIRSNIITVKDITDLSINKISCISGIGSISLYEIINSIHSFGLSFNGEITNKKKFKNFDLNDSIEFLNLSAFPLGYLLRCNKNTISDVINSSCYDLKLDIPHFKELADCIHFLGLTFSGELVTYNHKKIDLDSTIDCLCLSYKSIDFLKKAGINTINDIINISKDELENMTKTKNAIFHEIVNVIKSLGLDFYDINKKNNVEKDQVIIDNVDSQTSDVIMDRINLKNNLLSNFQSLINEKEILLKREKELDLEIEYAIKQINSLMNGEKYEKVRK